MNMINKIPDACLTKIMTFLISTESQDLSFLLTSFTLVSKRWQAIPRRTQSFTAKNLNDNEIKKIAFLFKALIHLDISESLSVTEKGLMHLRVLPLKTLNLSSSLINDQKLQALLGERENAPSILRTTLTNCNLSDCLTITHKGLAVFAGMHLTVLSLKRCIGIKGKGLCYLQDMPLQTLDMLGCKVTDQNLIYMKKMPLRSLSLSNCDITDSGLQTLQSLQLVCLNLANCAQITDQGLKGIQVMPLEELGLWKCVRVTKEFQKTLKGEDLEKFKKHKFK